MAEDNQLQALAPATVYGRSDEELAEPALKPINHSRKDHHSSKWLVYVLLAVVIISTVSLFFSSIFLRVTSPTAKLASVSVKNLRYDKASFNVTLNSVVRIKNPNFGRFLLADGGTTTAVIMYEGVVIGHGSVPGGRVKSTGTEKLDVTMEVGSSGLSDANKSMDLSRDIGLGILELRSYANLSGKVYLMDNIVKKRKHAEWNCTMNLNFTSKAIQDLVCRD